MCCLVDSASGRFIIGGNGVRLEGTEVYLTGIYDRTPETLGERFSRFFQRLDLIEKIAEVVDECFHLLGSFFQRYTNLMVYQTLRNLHHAAHDIEHVLHSFCFLGDITHLLTGKFIEYIEYQDGEHRRKRLDYLSTTSRACHMVAHFFATSQFLQELKLFSLNSLEKAFKYTSVFSATGYALGGVSLIWQSHQGKVDDQFMSKMGIQVGGFLFEAIHLTKTINFFVPYTSFLNKTAAIAGIIHALLVVQRLMPKDREDLSVHFPLPQENNGQANYSHVHHHHCNGHAHHSAINR